jgi:hypothetical protein
MSFAFLYNRTPFGACQVLALMANASCPSLMSRDPVGRGWERGGESEFERFCSGVGGVFATQKGTVERSF